MEEVGKERYKEETWEILSLKGGEEKLPAGRGSKSQGSAWAGDNYDSEWISRKGWLIVEVVKQYF